MQNALRTQTTVLPGHRVEITAPELPEGADVEVILLLPPAPAARRSILEFLDSLPPGPRSYPTWEDFEKRLQEDRNAWDR